MDATHTPSTGPALGAAGSAARHLMEQPDPRLSAYITHPYKPPQPGLEPEVLGRSGGGFAAVRIMDNEAQFGGVRLMAQRYGSGAISAKLAVELSTPGNPARGVEVRGPGLEEGSEGRRFWNPTIRGPLFVAQEGRYLTSDASDRRVDSQWRAALLSAPGKLEFTRPQSDAVKVLMAGHEELRNEPGAFLSKAVVAFRVTQEGPAPSGVIALRTFTTVPPKNWDNTQVWKPEQRQTDKFRFLFGHDGLQVLNYDGHDAVSLARRQAKAAEADARQRRSL